MLLGSGAGVLGCFAFLRQRALLGDALAHATLPGVCLAFLLTGSKHPLVLLAGAAVTGCARRRARSARSSASSRIKEDAALALTLSVFFGAGIVLLTRIQKTGDAAQAGLDKFLFGQAASLVPSDVVAARRRDGCGARDGRCSRSRSSSCSPSTRSSPRRSGGRSRPLEHPARTRSWCCRSPWGCSPSAWC